MGGLPEWDINLVAISAADSNVAVEPTNAAAPAIWLSMTLPPHKYYI